MVRARLVRTESYRRWCGSVRQGTATAAKKARMRRATVEAGTEVQAGALTAALVVALVTTEAGRGKAKGVKSQNPLPSSYRTTRVAEESSTSNFR